MSTLLTEEFLQTWTAQLIPGIFTFLTFPLEHASIPNTHTQPLLFSHTAIRIILQSLTQSPNQVLLSLAQPLPCKELQ